MCLKDCIFQDPNIRLLDTHCIPVTQVRLLQKRWVELHCNGLAAVVLIRLFQQISRLLLPSR